MYDHTNDEITLTTIDAERLRVTIAAHAQQATASLLTEEIARARLVPQSAIPPDVVTMNSRVLVRDDATGKHSALTLVYPRDADADQGRVSVLAPMGSALLGLSVGQTIEWPLPGGRTKRIAVLRIDYQPEAAGDFDR
ncbi:MAG: nucleoside diphosphate kinase regulator [Polyangiaceae bacterium]